MGIRADRLADYEGFVKKFQPKRTTDDCMTPAPVYDAVLSWAIKEYSLEGRKIVRPFWPGGDYENFRYPKNCVVIDNPPFSIFSRICRDYVSRGIDFFLFAPALTIASSTAEVCNIVIPSSADVVFENGARICIAFATNMGEWYIQTRPDLAAAIKASMRRTYPGNNPQVHNAVELPKEVCTPARLLKLKADWRVRREEATFTRTVGECKYALFGGGFLLSERAAAERAAAERAAAERAAAYKVELSAREREIVEQLGKEPK